MKCLISALLILALPLSINAQERPLSEEQQLNIIARDISKFIEAMQVQNGPVASFGEAIVALNGVLVGGDAADALGVARAALEASPLDDDAGRGAVEPFDFSDLRKTRISALVEELERAQRAGPGIIVKMRDHILRLMAAVEAEDVRELKRLVAASTEMFNLEIARLQLALNKAALQLIAESSPQHWINRSWMLTAEAQIKVMEQYKRGAAGLPDAVIANREAARLIRDTVAEGEARIEAHRANAMKPGADATFIRGRSERDWMLDVLRLEKEALNVELRRADAFERMAAAFERIAEDGMSRELGRIIAEIDQDFLALDQERIAAATEVAPLLEVFRDREL